MRSSIAIVALVAYLRLRGIDGHFNVLPIHHHNNHRHGHNRRHGQCRRAKTVKRYLTPSPHKLSSPPPFFIPEKEDESEEYYYVGGEDEEEYDDDDYDEYESSKERSRNSNREGMRRGRPWKMSQGKQQSRRQFLSTKLLFINAACYVAQVMFPSITQWGSKRSDLLLRGKELHRFLTPVFLHGGILHLIMNSSSLTAVGPEVEKSFGSVRFIATYMASGIMGNVFSAFNSPNPSVGASGAIFGLFGAHYVFLLRNDQFLGYAGDMQLAAVSQTIASNVFLGFFNPMIDNWAHFGGAVGGGLMSFAIGPNLKLVNVPGEGRIVVDRPTIQLPVWIESISRTVGKSMGMLRQSRDHVEQYKSDYKGTMPWRASSPSRQQQMRIQPGKSIKPRRL